MGNDIVSAFIERKKDIIKRSSLFFVKYLVDEKVKLNRTIESMTAIYFRDFYLQEEFDFQELESYFSIPNLKDDLLKESLLSAIRFYKENGIESKIEEDIKTIVLLSNAFFLTLNLELFLEKNLEKNSQEWLKLFLRKYQNKIRINNEEKKNEFEKELFSFVKKEESVYKKFFKLLESSQFHVSLTPLLDYTNGYIAESYYEIKSLSRYSEKEIKQVFQKKNIYLNQFIITLERLSIHFLKQLIEGKPIPKFFIYTPIDIVEKETYWQMVKSVTVNCYFRSSLVFVFSHHYLSHHAKVAKTLVENDFSLGVVNLKEVEMSPNSFEYVKYVFISPSFLDSHSRYYTMWEDKNIRFIIWEGEMA